MKLQKLLYYAQAYALGMTGQPLFDDEIQAWQHGPVVPIAYRAYSRYERAPILDVEETAIPEEEAPMIRSLIIDKGRLSASELRNMTHDEAPWREAWNTWTNHGPMPVISPEAIEEHFAPQFWGSDEEDEYQPVFDSRQEEKEYFLKGLTEEERDAVLASR